MRHEAPRQKNDGTWGYTTATRNDCYAIGYCRPFEEWSEQSIAHVFGGDQEEYERYIAPYRAVKEKFHDGGHNTAEEACECYKQYLLDFDVRFRDDVEDANALYKCAHPDCKEYTSGSAEITGSMRHWVLCASHRNIDVVKSMLTVGEAWCS